MNGFNAHEYFHGLWERNRLLQTGAYKYCKVSGISYMEEAIQKFQRERAYFCVDAAEDGNTYKKGGSFFERRQHTVFILKKFPYGNLDEQGRALEECRAVYRSLLKRLIRDRARLENEMTYLVLDRISFNEIPGYFLSGCTGLYFVVAVDIPVDLCYDASEWTD